MLIRILSALLLGLGLSTASRAEVSIGAPAPDFTLTDPSGTSHQLSALKGKFVVLEWVNHGCPFVVKHYQAGNLQKLQAEATDQGVVWLAICSSAPGKQGYHPAAEWPALNEEKGFKGTALLLDADGTVGRLYGAKTTPHMFVINPEGMLIYQGALDNQPTPRESDIAQAHNYVRSALAEARAGKPVTTSQTQPYGCGVKYGN